ncbi:UDP-N-acetylmuramoyl-L-alanyl-D-glutamate--2,6-diaminopimelate ligase [Bifidobacterium sp. ESL0790]|uniref:UDP-N-acetylmuramoyl-L-alanyl-D-glutamate--2, 6-diaminopimelate ligase n=1 Tax=Bifidobacterium sp. ESL0790 TaxID=2983233 RepID=UPI0023F67563|nr:UDP-N-acetylmuramoyl-L-alanyl-D-glutamate--2,6-diaminopimelate ligase [Bifidobacterium sp. ESL0790]WEV72877.1 UDP-N-acetylmuramoyl-L-alanyl-D-glutamate--2,6-diaminopimelate ligase [Bifidobacterium sp. ESL0790]
MALTLTSAARLLEAHHLLREIIQGDQWSRDPARFEGADEPYSAITYNSLEVGPGAILCCKGRFKASYLDGCDAKGLKAYVSETPFSDHTTAPGIIVSDIRKAMSLLSAEFYGRPQDELTLVGITGTKGKTTTVYFTQAILNAASGGKAALFSSVDNCLDGHTYTESNLTTPESMDAFRMMRQAVDNGMKYLVMEVSSQAYKVDRVYGLTFDVGAFLNISPDHISPIEHPTFEDYLYCKRQLASNSRAFVLNADCDHADLIAEDAAAAHVPVTTFALHTGGESVGTPADTVAWPADKHRTSFHISVASVANNAGANNGATANDVYHLRMDGDFNYANASAALTIASLAGVDLNANPEAAHALEQVRISGRLEQFRDSHDERNAAIIDFAHNYASVTAVIDFALERYGEHNPRLTLVTGTAGGKANDRRREIVEAAQHRVARLILTTDDPDRDDPADICREMAASATDPKLDVNIVLDRGQAIETAVREAREHDGFDVVMVIGKGEEQWLKVDGKHAPYEGDAQTVRRLFGVPGESTQSGVSGESRK